MFSALTVFAKIKGYKSAWDLICQNFENLAIMEKSDSIEEDGITLIRGSDAIHYSSIDEFVSEEQLNILIPTVLPYNTKIERVLLFDEGNERFTWNLQFSNDSLEITIKNIYTPIKTDNSVIYQTKSTNFYIYESADGKYQAIGQVDGYEYTIRYTDYEELIKILNNMKGTE